MCQSKVQEEGLRDRKARDSDTKTGDYDASNFF